MYGDRFYDPDIENDLIFQKVGRRDVNKQRTKDVLSKYSEFKAQAKLEKLLKKKRRMARKIRAEHGGDSVLDQSYF